MWYLWTNTESLLDACFSSDTSYLATPGGLVILVNGSVNKTINKLDGLKGTDVISISCKNGLWVLSGGALQHYKNGKFYTVDLIAFEDPDEVLNARRIRSVGDFLYILGKSKVMVYKISESTEVVLNFRFSKPKFLEIFGDSVFVGDTLGLYKAKYDDFLRWDTLFYGRPVFSAIKHPTLSWLIGTDDGVKNLSGSTLWLSGKVIRFLSLRGDTVYLATDSSLYRLSPPSYSPFKLLDGYVSYLSENLFGLGRINSLYYMFGYGIYTLPNLQRIRTGGLPYTTITGMVLLGDSLIACGRGGYYACAVWPSGNTFGFGITNFVRKFNDRVLILGLHGGGLVLLLVGENSFKDTVIFTPSRLGGFSYVFDMAVFRDTVYFIAWEPSGSSKLFKLSFKVGDSIFDTVLTDVLTDYAMDILYSVDDKLIMCGQGNCKFYSPNLNQYASINVKANVVYNFGDTLLFGTDDGVEMYSLRSLGYLGKVLAGKVITGLWVGLDGSIWASGSMGLARLRGNSLKIYSPENSPIPGISLSPSVLYPIRFSLLSDLKNGRIFVATEKGIGIFSDSLVLAGWWENVKVYPNPALKGKEVKILNCPPNSTLRIFTSSGFEIKREKGCSFKNDLAPGFYLIVLESMGRRTTVKFVSVER
jgi:hypothetical protein